MPSTTSRNTIIRQWELLKLLPSRGAGKTSRELAEQLNGIGYKVSKRQVERDLGDLLESFPLECNNASIPYGWKWIKGASVDLPGITVAEALSLKLLEGTLRSLLPASIIGVLQGRFEQASKTLAALSGRNRASGWIKKVSSVPANLPLMPPEIDATALECAQNALMNGHQLDVMYQAGHEDIAKPLTLHPLGLIVQGPVTYLIATAYHYNDPRFYALHRFKSAEESNKRTKAPEGFNLNDFVASGAAQFQHETGRKMTLKAEITPSLAQILSETPLSPDQNMSTKAEKTLVSATVPDSWRLRWWIMSQGEAIIVHKPIALRREIADRLESAASRYQ